MKIVVALTVQNGGEFLARSLESVKDVGPIVAVDGGSTDQTVATLAVYNATTVISPWPGNFAIQFNRTLAAVAKYHPDAEWCYFHAADEILTARPGELEALAIQAGSHRRMYAFPRRWMLSETTHDAAVANGGGDYQNRLLPMVPGLSYDEAEVVHCQAKLEGCEIARVNRPEILHYQRIVLGVEGVKRKLQRYNEMLEGQGDRFRNMFLPVEPVEVAL